MPLDKDTQIELLKSQVETLEAVVASLQRNSDHAGFVISIYAAAMAASDERVAALQDELRVARAQLEDAEATVDADGEPTGFPMFLDEISPGGTD